MGLLEYLGFPPRKSRRPVAPRGAPLRGRRLGLEVLEPRALLTALPTFTALGLSTPSATAGQPVTFTAQVSAPGSPSAAPSGGIVTFTDGATVIGTAPLVNGTASLVNSLFALGSQSVRASYSGNGDGLAGSLSAVGSANISVASVAGGAASGYAIPMHVATPAFAPNGGAGPMSTAAATGMTPTEIRQAYGFNAISFGSTLANGAGTTIAIVDAYDDPNIAGDLHQFDQYFGLPDPTFTKVNQTGGGTLPAINAGWATEIALDVQWAHAVAPGARILLVEANSSSYSDLMTAVNYASHASGVVAVSMSWGGSEWSGETAYDSYFTTPGVTFLASSGDTGAAGLLSLGFAQRGLRGRHDARAERAEQLQQRIRLERQRRGRQRRRAAAGLPGGRGHAAGWRARQSRRLLRCGPQLGLPRLRHVEQPGLLALGPVGRDQRRVSPVGGLDRHRRPGPCAGRPGLAEWQHAIAPHALLPAGRRFPRRHHRHQRRSAQLFGGPRLRPGHRPRHARGRPAGPRFDSRNGDRPELVRTGFRARSHRRRLRRDAGGGHLGAVVGRARD